MGFVSGVIVAAASCDDPNDRYRNCDYVDTQCNQVCDYSCDYYSCYPTCWTQCWDQCRDGHRHYPGVTGASSSGAPVTDATVVAPPPTDASAPVTDGGTGVLCTACISNSDCEKGALCILRGGPPRDAGADGGAVPGRGFCGAACTTTQDCPDGFLCSQLGSSRQCLPTGNACQ